MKARYLMTSSNKPAPSQIVIEEGNKEIFQSYTSIIAIRENGKVVLDPNYWNYSVTTSRYLYQFLGEDRKTILKKIKEGQIKFESLN